MTDDTFVPLADTLHVRVDGDVVRVRNHRSMTLRDFNALMDVYARVRAEHGMLFALFDCSRAEGVEREARMAMTAKQSTAPVADATAIFGASFAICTVVNMMERARILLGGVATGMSFSNRKREPWPTLTSSAAEFWQNVECVDPFWTNLAVRCAARMNYALRIHAELPGNCQSFGG